MIAIKIAVFILAFGLGLEAASFVRYYASTLDEEIKASRQPNDHTGHWKIPDGPPKEFRLHTDQAGSGSSGTNPNAEFPRKGVLTTPLRIVSKKKAEYTEAARTNGTQGMVTLRVTFLASGEIGPIIVVKGLPDGLTENATAAARYIEFEPEYVDGVPRTTSRPVTFTFNIY